MGQQKLSLNRIIIFGNLVGELRDFYVENFGFTIIEEIKDQWIVLSAGNMEIAIHKIGHGYEPNDGEKFRANSNTKLVFSLNENLDLFRKQLVEKGVVVGDIKSFKGINSLFCDGEDPEGNVFQIEQKLG